jgi:hypothetical protein
MLSLVKLSVCLCLCFCLCVCLSLSRTLSSLIRITFDVCVFLFMYVSVCVRVIKAETLRHSRFMQTFLPFVGKNLVLYMMSSDYEADANQTRA